MLRSVYNVDTLNDQFLMKCLVNMIATPPDMAVNGLITGFEKLWEGAALGLGFFY